VAAFVKKAKEATAYAYRIDISWWVFIVAGDDRPAHGEFPGGESGPDQSR